MVLFLLKQGVFQESMLNLINHWKIPIHHKNLFIKQYFQCLNVCKNFKSNNSKNHYEILNLSRNCTSKEIREAFIKLSKQYHPDKNKGNPKAQEEFVKVSEAYNVLSKPESRQNYDFSLSSFTNPSRVYKSGKKDDYYEVHRYDFRDPWKDPSFFRNRNFKDEGNNEDYYGIKGIKKLPNKQFVLWILLYILLGILFHTSVLRYFNSHMRIVKDKESAKNREYLEFVETRAGLYGSRERQLEEFLRRAGYVTDDNSETRPKEEDVPD